MVLPVSAFITARAGLYFFGEVHDYFRPLEGPLIRDLGGLFTAPPPWAVVAFLPALFEELCWRGYLQGKLVGAFGLKRGLFLLGIIWAVWHLPTDVGQVGGESTWRIGAATLVRFLFVLLLTIPIGWLFERTRSVLLTTIMHGGFNILRLGQVMAVAREFPLLAPIEVLVMGIAGVWLFRRFGPTRKAGLSSDHPATM